MLSCIKNDFPSHDDKYQLQLIKELGLTLLKSPPKKMQPKLDYLNLGWECTKKAQDADVFLDAAIILVDFAIKNL